ncbi:hypothetical protein HFP65_02520 [Bacillus sp. CB62A.1]
MLTNSPQNWNNHVIVVMALFVTALAACGNNCNPEEVATAYFEDGNSLLSN